LDSTTRHSHPCLLICPTSATLSKENDKPRSPDQRQRLSKDPRPVVDTSKKAKLSSNAGHVHRESTTTRLSLASSARLSLLCLSICRYDSGIILENDTICSTTRGSCAPEIQDQCHHTSKKARFFSIQKYVQRRLERDKTL
jgi:hypothetical protein